MDKTILGTSPDDGTPVGYSQEDRSMHTHVLGVSGTGKSTLLENIAMQDIGSGRGGMYIDPHGDSARRVFESARGGAVLLLLDQEATADEPAGLVDSEGRQLDLGTALRARSYVVVSGHPGALADGSYAAAFNSLVFSLAAATRGGIGHPFNVIVDEFQAYLEPGLILDLLAYGRNYGLGITMANQAMSQLPEGRVREAVLENVGNRISFGLDVPDARLLEPHFSPLKAADLESLPAFRIAARAACPESMGVDARVLVTLPPAT